VRLELIVLLLKIQVFGLMMLYDWTSSKGHNAFIFVVKQSKTRLLDHKDEDTTILKTLGHINSGFNLHQILHLQFLFDAVRRQ